MTSYMRVLVASGLCLAAGAITVLFVSTDAGSWYDGLAKPALTPPAWTFPYVIGIQYFLMAISVSIMWTLDRKPHDFRGWVPLFFAHLIANMAWTILFFGFHAIFIAAMNAIILAIVVFLLMCGALVTNKLAGYVLIPYLIWVIFAIGINLSIWLMN